MIIFEIFGIPIAQGRAKFYRRGDYVGAYDPKKSKDAKHDFKSQSLQYKPNKLITEAISLDLIFYLPRPKSLPKKVMKHIKRPDLDNLIKLVKDALTGIFWKDDSQIIMIIAEKKYCPVNETPRTRVEIEEVDNPALR